MITPQVFDTVQAFQQSGGGGGGGSGGSVTGMGQFPDNYTECKVLHIFKLHTLIGISHINKKYIKIVFVYVLYFY